MLLDGADDKEPTTGASEAEPKEPAAAEIPPAPEAPTPVALAPAKSRRQRIEEEYTSTLRGLKDSLESVQRGLSERDQRIGELTGHIQALSSRTQAVPQQQYAPPPPQLPDPDELERKALERLDAKDMAGYHRFTREAASAHTIRQLAPILARQQQQPQAPQQEQIPAGLMPFFAAYPEVASHPQSMRLLASENERLEALGMPRGPDRVKVIFDNIRSALTAGRPAGAASFSQQSAQVLSGVPTARPSNSGGSGGAGPRVDLTTEERTIAKRAGFSDAKMAELVMKNDPGRVIR